MSQQRSPRRNAMPNQKLRRKGKVGVSQAGADR